MDELRKFYPNVSDNLNQNVQHFIAQDVSAQLQHNQEIYISSPDKLIVENNQQQHIILNQAYPNQQYIIQDASMDNRQPIFYMEDGMPTMLVAQIAQPINLCNAIGANMPRVVAPVMKPVEKTPKVSLMAKSQVRGQLPNKMPMAQVAKAQASVNETGTNTDNSEVCNLNVDTVTLPDGRIISLTDYKKLLSPKKPQRVSNPKPRASRAKPAQARKLTQKQIDAEALLDNMSADDSSQNMHRQQQSCIMGAPQNNQPLHHFPIPRAQIEEFIEQTPVSEEYSDSIRMLVLLVNGEQRLITFTIPKEQCTIQEILEQIGIVIEPETLIDSIESDINGINYIVSVGMPNPYRKQEILLSKSSDDGSSVSTDTVVLSAPKAGVVAEKAPIQYRQLSPPPPVPEPKFVQGRLAVCTHCGYLSEDFNKCLRCRRKLPEDVKSVPTNTSVSKQSKNQKIPTSTPTPTPLQTPPKSVGGRIPVQLTEPKNPVRRKITKAKVVEQEPIILTLSSDDEEEDTAKTTVEEHLSKMNESSAHLSAMKKEPSISDLQQIASQDAANKFAPENKPTLGDQATIALNCRTIRIGSYRFTPSDDVLLSGTSVIMMVPHVKNPEDVKTIVLNRENIVKVLVNFQKALPVIFYYTSQVVGKKVRDMLGMSAGDENYFDPISKEEAYKRITILPEDISDEAKMYLKQLYGKPFSLIDELTNKEANNILMKTCPKEANKIIIQQGSFTDIRQLLIYPPGKGGLSINTEDYMCLAQDQFLNDVIIDFYLKYLVIHLPADRQAKVHVFSTFFYNRLTTKPSRLSRRVDSKEQDPNLTPAEKRHARVSKWTKNVNLFDKDYIIIPINENSHWFLAIICFPSLGGVETLDGKPFKEELAKKKEKTVKPNVTLIPVKLEKEAQELEEDEVASNKDEAEADESELESEDGSETSSVEENVTSKSPIKQPCILIFDSLACTKRSRVIATLRDYLTVEYKTKMGVEKVYTKDVIKGSYPKVPQQTNFTDCGLYLLQFVESFFKTPVTNYRLPIKTLKNWFDEITVTKKREDLSMLIKELMILYNKDTSCLPELLFPTFNGKLQVEDEEEEEEDMFGHEEEMAEEEHMQSFEDHEGNKDTVSDASSTFKEITLSPTIGKVCNDNKNNSAFLEQSVVVKPDLSEVQKQSNRETLSYLKAKRIIRHKGFPNDPETKKLKLDQ